MLTKLLFPIFLLVAISITGFLYFISEEKIGGISPELQLKADKADIIYSQEFLDENGTLIVSYAYKSGEIVPVLDDEILEKRTENIVTRNLGGDKRSAQSGYNFYREGNDWKQIKFATTTKEVFDKTAFNWIEKVFAAQTASTSPGTMADDATVGTVAWSNPNNAKVSDNVYATALDGNVTTHYLKATNFGFLIPAGATINGILVEVEKGDTFGGNWAKDSAVKIVKSDGTIGTTNKGDTTNYWPYPEAYKSYGSSSDLWNETWTSEDINDIDFGVVFSALLTDTGPEGPTFANVDHIRITVFFSEATGGGAVPPANIILFE